MRILPAENPGPALSTRRIALMTFASAPKRCARAAISASGIRAASCARNVSSEKPDGGPDGRGGSGGGAGGGAGGVAGGGAGGVAGGGAGGVAGGGAGGVAGGGAGVRGGGAGGVRGGGGGDVGRVLPRVPKMARKTESQKLMLIPEI